MGLVSGSALRRAVLMGLCVGLALGWLGSPRLAWQAFTQPIRFSHSAHARQDIPCATCHQRPGTGEFSGLPGLAVCADCHAEPTGAASDDGREIDKFVWDYVKRGREVPWLAFLREPGHVRFVHGPHLKADCAACHPDMRREDYPSRITNRLSGDVKGWTMRMDRCRACHAREKASEDCLVCHR